MNNTVTVNKKMVDLAIRFDNGHIPTDKEIEDLINSSFESNVTCDAHLLTHWICKEYNLEFDTNDIQPHKYIKMCLSDFRLYLNKRIKNGN